MSLCIRNNPPLDNIDSKWKTPTGMVIMANSNRTSGSLDEIFCYNYSVQSLEEKDYGNYTLMLNSSRGSESFRFQVISPLAPSPPLNVAVVCNGTTANLSWTAGSAGGASTKGLSFFLLYHEESIIPTSKERSLFCYINWRIENVINKGNINVHNRFLKNGIELAQHSFNFQDLDSSKLYVFELYAVNAIKHCSALSQSVKCKTSYNLTGVNVIIIRDF